MAIPEIDITNLEEKEFETINNVLKRDRALRMNDDTRLFQLKMELQSLRKRGALRQGIDASRSCARCTSELGRLINRGALCAVCRKKVCKACRQYGDIDKHWVCIVCQKQMEFKALSGEWMQEFCRRPSKRRTRRVPPGDILRKAIHETRRRGTINRERHHLTDVSKSEKQSVDKLKPANNQLQVVKSTKKPESPLVHEIRKQLKKIDLQPIHLKRSESQPVLDKTQEHHQSPPVIEEIKRHFKGSESPFFQEIKRRLKPTVSDPIEESTPDPPRLKYISKSVETLSTIAKNYQQEEEMAQSRPNSSSSGCGSPELSGRRPQSEVKKHGSPLQKQKAIWDTDSAYSTSPRTVHLKPTDHRLTSGSVSSISESEIEKTTGVVFRKVTLKKRRQEDERRERAHSDESSLSHRSSPHGRLRARGRSLSGGSDDSKHEPIVIPQIAVSDYAESSRHNSVISSDKDSIGAQEDDVDQVFSYHSRSQISLSSFPTRSESMTSVYSAAGGGRYGTVVVSGEVLFSLNYNYKASTMEVHVKECRNIAAVDTKRNRSDPYIKIYLLPDRTKSGKRKTKVKKHTLNPNFDETLKFHVTVSELETRTLWLSVWHSDIFGRNDFLGEVMLPLGYEVFENPGLHWYPLQERLESLETPISYKGDLIIALKYVPPDVTTHKPTKRSGGPVKGSLHVLVKEARNLMAVRSNGTSDPFCKSYLLPDKSKSGKQKTQVVKKTCNPKWNHTFVYDDISIEELHNRCLELTIWDYDKITSNDFLGGVRLNLGMGKYEGRDVEWMDAQGEEMAVWRSVLDRPNMWVDCSLLLRSSMQSRRSL